MVLIDVSRAAIQGIIMADVVLQDAERIQTGSVTVNISSEAAARYSK